MTRKREDLSREHVGDLSGYAEDELANLRELVILDLSRLDDEVRQADRRIKAFNQRKQELAHERAERGALIRAIKHQLSQRSRGMTSPPRGRLRAMR